MSKTYKNGRKQNKKMLTRKRKGGFMNYLNTQIEKGKQMANKHYEDAKRIATPHAERMMNQTMNKMKPTYDKMKNSNDFYRSLFSKAEKYGNSALEQGKLRFNPNGMKPKNIEQAVNGSVAGVPQSSQYPRAQVATMSPTTV